MSGGHDRLAGVLDGYANFLREKELALPNRQPFRSRLVKDLLCSPELAGKRKQDAFLAAMQIKRVERPRPRGHGAERRDSPGQPAKVGMARDGWSRGRDRSTRRVDMVFGANKTWFADQPEDRAFSLRESCACPSEFWFAKEHIGYTFEQTLDRTEIPAQGLLPVLEVAIAERNRRRARRRLEKNRRRRRGTWSTRPGTCAWSTSVGREKDL